MIEEIKNIDINSKRDLDSYLINVSGFMRASKEEKDEWPYKSELAISPINLIGKELFEYNKSVGIVSDINYKKHRGRKVLKLITENGEYSLTNCSFEFKNSLYLENQIVELHPSRKGRKFWSLGYVLNESDYKSLYYKTKEYRSKYEKSLNENLGTNGLKSPIQSKKIKYKISKTMNDRYGVNWFLERGCHYSAVTMTMQDKFGVDNLFYSDEWQAKIHDYGNGISKLETEVVEVLIDEFGDEEVFCFSKDNKQVSVVDFENKQTYFLDYLNKELGLIVEVHGDYWHCNPSVYDKDFLHPQKNRCAHEIWDYDKNRINSIERLTGFRVFVVWEKEWKNNKNEIIKSINKFINENCRNKVD